jgi:hypothetical protein
MVVSMSSMIVWDAKPPTRINAERRIIPQLPQKNEAFQLSRPRWISE